MEKKLFGKMPDGREVYAYTLKNARLSAEILSLGGIIRILSIDGDDILGGFDTLEDILKDTSYQGSLIGRYGNRIKNAQFELNGKTYSLFANSGKHNHLHGGKEGFNRKIWKAEPQGENTLVLSYRSVDGEEGYPGNLDVTVTYTLLPDGLAIGYQALSDKDTYVNLTNHSYFNLDGIKSGSLILDHHVKLNADCYTAVDNELIPTGEHPDVTGTPFDFRRAKTVRRDLSASLEGYDHNFVLNGSEKASCLGHELTVAAEVYSAKNRMTVLTDMPCIQFYTANFLGRADLPMKGNTPQQKRMALCLETQFEPDSPTRHENILKAGEKYDHLTVYKFM